jgi:hypothetical protein
MKFSYLLLVILSVLFSIPSSAEHSTLNAVFFLSESSGSSATVDNTVSAASSIHTLCINTALTDIKNTTTGASGIGTPVRLPSGESAFWSSNAITISGMPTVAGTYNYSIPLTGGSGIVNATGTIIVGAGSPKVTISDSLTSICAGESTKLNASGAANVVTTVINWSNGDYTNVYSNPVISLMQVDYKLGMQREFTLKVYDMSGREVLEQTNVKNGEQVNMSR